MPEAIVRADDLPAIGALDALTRAAGVRVPQDLLVVGFDNVPEASCGVYDLTTVAQDVP